MESVCVSTLASDTRARVINAKTVAILGDLRLLLFPERRMMNRETETDKRSPFSAEADFNQSFLDFS